MPRQKVELSTKYFSPIQARKQLKLSRFQFDIRITRGVFPAPTYTDPISKNRYFNENWIAIAKAILDKNGQN